MERKLHRSDGKKLRSNLLTNTKEQYHRRHPDVNRRKGCERAERFYHIKVVGVLEVLDAMDVPYVRNFQNIPHVQYLRMERKPNIILFTGSNTVFLERDLKAWKKIFIEKHGDINLLLTHPDTRDPSQTISECLTP